MHLRRIFDEFLGHAEAYPIRGLYFFIYAGNCIEANFLLVVLRQEGFSGKQISYVASVIPFLGLFAQPLWGVIADRSNRRRCLQIATLVAAGIYFLMYWTRGFWPFLYIAVGLALFRTPLVPLMDAVALDFVEDRRKLSYGMFRIWGAIAAGVGTAGAGFLIEGHATRTSFLWAAAALFAGVVFSLTAEGGPSRHAVEKIRLRGLVFLARNVPLMSILIVIFFVAVASTAFWNFNGVCFTDIGASSKLFGLAIAIDTVGEIPFYFLADPIFKRIGLQRALLLTLLSSVLRLFAYAFIRDPQVAIWVELSNGISWTLFWVAAVEYVKQLVSPEWRATGQALLCASCFGAGTILGVLWNGMLLDYFTSHFVNSWVPLPIQKVCFVSGLLLAIVTLLSAMVLRTGRQQPSAGPSTVTAAREEVA